MRKYTHICGDCGVEFHTTFGGSGFRCAKCYIDSLEGILIYDIDKLSTLNAVVEWINNFLDEDQVSYVKSKLVTLTL